MTDPIADKYYLLAMSWLDAKYAARPQDTSKPLPTETQRAVRSIAAFASRAVTQGEGINDATQVPSFLFVG